MQFNHAHITRVVFTPFGLSMLLVLLACCLYLRNKTGVVKLFAAGWIAKLRQYTDTLKCSRLLKTLCAYLNYSNCVDAVNTAGLIYVKAVKRLGFIVPLTTPLTWIFPQKHLLRVLALLYWVSFLYVAYIYKMDLKHVSHSSQPEQSQSSLWCQGMLIYQRVNLYIKSIFMGIMSFNLTMLWSSLLLRIQPLPIYTVLLNYTVMRPLTMLILLSSTVLTAIKIGQKKYDLTLKQLAGAIEPQNQAKLADSWAIYPRRYHFIRGLVEWIFVCHNTFFISHSFFLLLHRKSWGQRVHGVVAMHAVAALSASINIARTKKYSPSYLRAKLDRLSLSAENLLQYRG